jgi:hypothetical protein
LGKLEEVGCTKMLGGWGLKNIFLFAKSLAAKSVWRLIVTKNLWTEVVSHKYIKPDTVEGWLRNTTKKIDKLLNHLESSGKLLLGGRRGTGMADW